MGWKLSLQVKVSNDGTQSVSVYLEQSIWYDGQQLSDWQVTDSVMIESGEKHHFKQAISIFQPLLWDIDHPYIYQLKTRLYKMACWLMKRRLLVTVIWIGKRIGLLSKWSLVEDSRGLFAP